MSDEGHITMSQGLDVLKPKSGRAYPIPCAEWNRLKENLNRVSGTPFVFVSVGFTLAGAALATWLNILTENIPSGTAHIVAWAIVVVTFVLGVVFIAVAFQQNRFRKQQVSDVVAQMELIEERYESLEEQKAPATVPQLIINKATYGASGKFYDVTELLRKLVVNGRLNLPVCNAFFQDPIFGTPKALEVEYQFQGKTVIKTFAEGVDLLIP